MSVLAAVLSVTMIAQTVRMSVPYAAAAAGGVLSEKSGVINIALEGTLLVSAFAAIAVHVSTGSATLGLLAGVAAGAAFNAIHAALFAYGKVDAIISGLALNLAAAGGTRFFLRGLYGSSSNSPSVTGFRVPGLEGGGGGMLLLRTLIDPATLLTIAGVAFVFWILSRTGFGLRVIAAGEDPRAAASVGVPVARTRLIAVTIAGAVAGLGGVALSFSERQFQSGMSGGRGFIALAAVVLSGWRPRAAAVACVAFAALDALQIVLQGELRWPSEVLSSLPYVATLVALGLVLGRKHAGRAPSGLGKHAI